MANYFGTIVASYGIFNSKGNKYLLSISGNFFIQESFLSNLLVTIAMELIKISRETGIPLIGAINFGVIDRGTNLIQVRGTTVCNFRCTYCSTNANNSSVHPVNFEVDPSYLVDTVKEVIGYKNEPVECNIDSVGEPAAYTHLVELVSGLRNLPNVSRISMQTNGSLLASDKIRELEAAGLDQINLSINGLSPAIAKSLSGTNFYSLDRILETAKNISSSKITLLLAPVWIPGINDEEIPKVIKLAKELNAKVGIQKYEEYKYSRKVKGAKAINYWKFYRQLKEWEKEFGVKLLCNKQDFGIHKSPRLPVVAEEGDKLHLKIISPGWWKGQKLAAYKGRCITIDKCSADIGSTVKARITVNKNNIYLAELI